MKGMGFMFRVRRSAPTFVGVSASLRRSAAGVRRSEKSRGFTLVEVLVVLVIVGTLLGLVMGISAHATKAKRIAQARAAIETLHDAIQEYMLENGVYPLEDGTYSNDELAATTVTNWLPADFRFDDPWGNAYVYERRSKQAYLLFSLGPDGMSGSEDDIETGK